MRIFYLKRWLVLACFLSALTFPVLAQTSRTISGRVVDEANQPLPGATVSIRGTTRTAGVDEEGNYRIGDLGSGSFTLVASYIGYEALEKPVLLEGNSLTVDFQLKPASEGLDEVVVIGYGSQKKGELTGSVTTVSSKDFQKGVITSPDQLIVGKAAGVQITSSGGRPGSGSTIRIRAGASLNASNDPLIVIDGIPLSNTDISGAPDPLSLINPNDIETFTVLKDANATAIYGSRASNGVILITTKKGASGKPVFNFNTQHSLATIDRMVDVMSPAQLRDFIGEYGRRDTAGNNLSLGLLGDEQTNWQKEIFRPAYMTDNNVSMSGAYKFLPYRIAVGYLSQQGILKRDVMDRTSAAITLNPKFFDNHLKVDLNLKGSYQTSFYGNQDAIFSSLQFDPTKPVRAESPFGNYFEWMQGENPNPLAPRNPVGLVDLKEDNARVARSFGNLQLDYSFHFLPELRANLNLGYDVSRGQGDTFVPDFAAQNFTTQGQATRYLNDIRNYVGEFFLNYNNNFESIKSNLDLTAGYGYYDNKTFTNNYPTTRADGSVLVTPVFAFDIPQNTLISYFGRAIYNFDEKYILSGTIRTDGSSRFSPDNRWGFFPSAGFTWRIKNESFLKDSKKLSALNLRLSYGVTGQQDGIANYSYLPNYALNSNESQYQFGDNFYRPFSPLAYDQDIRWESTTTYNAGLDFGFYGGRLSGSVDVYKKDTRDLLSVIPIPVGTNFSNLLLTNVGNMENSGVELNLNAIPIQRDNFSWNLNFNVTYNRNIVTNLSAVDDPSYFTEVGDIEGSTGNTIQVHQTNYTPFSFRVYKQIYGDNGQPLEGVYEDRNGDGQITPAGDMYLYQSPLPKFLFGFSTGVTYREWSLSTVLRANLGNYVYDNISSNFATRTNVVNPNNIINNAPVDVLNTRFVNPQFMSDYYVHNASFLRMDNVALNYNVGSILNNRANLSLSATVQNVFVISRYHGVDPEIQSGIDNRFYPRPRTFVLGLNLGF